MGAEEASKDVEVGGVSLSVDASVLESFDFLDLLADLDDGEVFAFPRALKMLCGADYKRVKRELNAAHGGSMTAMEATGFFTELLTALNAKN